MPQPNAVKCLVVDDEPRLRRVLVRLLEGEGFSCAEAGSGTEALEILQQDPVPLVISDLRMPQMDGVTLLREIIARWPTTAVIVVTAVAEVESAVACLQLGALDYVAKPFHLDEVRARVMQALDKRRLKMELEDYRHNLEQRVQEQARRIEELSLERLQALVHFLEEKDPYTRGHSVRVANYSTRIAREMGLPQSVIEVITLGAELHDVSAGAVRTEGVAGARRGEGNAVSCAGGGGLPRRVPRPVRAAGRDPRDSTAASSRTVTRHGTSLAPLRLNCRHDRHIDGRGVRRARHRGQGPDARGGDALGAGVRDLGARRRETGKGKGERERRRGGQGCACVRTRLRSCRHDRPHICRL